MAPEITKEDWQDFVRHVGYSVLTYAFKKKREELKEALAMGATLSDNTDRDTAMLVARISMIDDFLEFNPLEENVEDEHRSNWVSGYR